jgi:hypothetical protein
MRFQKKAAILRSSTVLSTRSIFCPSSLTSTDRQELSRIDEKAYATRGRKIRLQIMIQVFSKDSKLPFAAGDFKKYPGSPG